MTLSATHPVSGRSEKAMRAIARANFAALDSNKDGRLDLSELAQAHASLTTPEVYTNCCCIPANLSPYILWHTSVYD